MPSAWHGALDLLRRKKSPSVPNKLCLGSHGTVGHLLLLVGRQKEIDRANCRCPSLKKRGFLKTFHDERKENAIVKLLGESLPPSMLCFICLFTFLII